MNNTTDEKLAGELRDYLEETMTDDELLELAMDLNKADGSCEFANVWPMSDLDEVFDGYSPSELILLTLNSRNGIDLDDDYFCMSSDDKRLVTFSHYEMCSTAFVRAKEVARAALRTTMTLPADLNAKIAELREAQEEPA